jgi:hypothetical protein
VVLQFLLNIVLLVGRTESNTGTMGNARRMRQLGKETTARKRNGEAELQEATQTGQITAEQRERIKYLY